MRTKVTAIFILIWLFATVVQAQSYDDFKSKDHYEKANRKIFKFNILFDRYIVNPSSKLYGYIPQVGRGAIGNFLTNLEEPQNMLNGILQLDIKSTSTSLWRFIMNSSFGLGGIYDFAGNHANLKYQDRTFDTTLKHYNVAEGSYIIVPFADPSTTRGAASKIVDWFSDPIGIFMTNPQVVFHTTTVYLAERDYDSKEIDQAYYHSKDPYIATRIMFYKD